MGKRIKMKRESLGFQMKELSLKIGVTSSLISQIESGKAYPSIVTLMKVAEALHTTVGELIGENEDLVHHPLLKSNDFGSLTLDCPNNSTNVTFIEKTQMVIFPKLYTEPVNKIDSPSSISSVSTDPT